MGKILIAISALATIAFITISVILLEVPITSATLSYTEQPVSENTEIKDVQYNEYISIVGNARQRDIDALTNEVASIPEHIVNSFIADGGNIYLTSIPLEEILKKHYGINYLASAQKHGLFIVNDGIPEIWLTSNVRAITAATLHEFAHYIDYSQGWLSGTAVFIEIYVKESKSFNEYIEKEEHFIGSSEEYFAESFVWYINNPDALKEHCPETYKFFKEIIPAQN